MSQYDKFHDYLSDLHQHNQRLTQLLSAKLEAVEKNDIDLLDEIVKEEQVFVLASKSFDANIQKYRQQFGFSGETLSEIILELPVDQQQRFRDLFKQLQVSLTASKQLNEKCQVLLEDRLQVVTKNIRKQESSKGPYQKPGDKLSGDARLLTKSI